MITRAIKKAFRRMKDKQWECTYWAIDVHETIVLPNWSADKIPTDFYPHAKETLQLISKQADIVMIMYTCSHPPEIQQYLKFFQSHDIHFKYVNENPEVINMKYGNYDKKPYFNVLFEDKAGFEATEDWSLVLDLIKAERGAS